MLFNFSLTPLEDVQPWGQPHEKRLSWFGLTDGEYWIQVGDYALLEYSEKAYRDFGIKRHCDYQVVRLYEDVLGMTPQVLEVIPDELTPYITGTTWHDWQSVSGRWLEKKGDEADSDKYWETVDAAFAWTGLRKLDTLYLSPSAEIYLWSDSTHVHFEWDNRNKLMNGVPAWSTLQGTYSLPREEFIAEVKSFHTRLIDQMGKRVREVMDGALPSDIVIDLAVLQREHLQRSRPVDSVFSGLPVSTDWQRVKNAIRDIQRESYGNKI